MALRIDTAVLKGELDNTERGRVRGKLWLMGRAEPVVLDLSGDPWRDVAGTRVTFVNPTPKGQPGAALLQPVQKGEVGDITASRKVKVFTVSDEEWQTAYRENRIKEVPTELRNSLYLEWFSTTQGRCVVESADFEITISESAWQLDEDEEGAQKLANMHAMRDYLATIIQRREPEEGGEEEFDEGAFSEEAWEEQLKASDRLTDANMEAMDKYGEDDGAQEKTAFVMGWDHMLEDMADAQEGVEPDENDSEQKKRRQEWADMMNEAAEEVESKEESEEWKAGNDDEGTGMDDFLKALDSHPLQKFSRDFLLQIMSELREADLDDIRGEDREHPLDRFMSNTMQISGKLSAALSMMRRRGEDSILDPGYTLAITKRCLNWANEALAALQELQTMEELAGHREMFEGWRAGLFKLREGITDLRRELRGE